MRTTDTLKWVYTSLLSQKKRAILTISGLVIGVMSVVLMNAVGESLRGFIMAEFTQFGSNIIAITPGKTETLGLGGMLNTVRPLSLEDAEDLQRMAEVEESVPVIMGTAKVKANGLGRHTDVAGVNYQALRAWQLSLASGQFLPNESMMSPRSYVVLGAEIKKALFSDRRALGEFVRIGGQRFKVRGVLAEKGQFMGINLDELVYIPAATAMQLFNRNSLMELDLFYRKELAASEVAEKVRQRLILRHGDEDFTLITQDDMLKSLDDILKIVALAAAALGGISLLVGAVGISTIMLINAQERTREIGLLRAIGCSAAQIRTLFLTEAVCLALFSGLFGILIVLTLALVVHLFVPNLPIFIDLTVFTAALVIVSLIGLIAGLYPAHYASKLLPVDALRSE